MRMTRPTAASLLALAVIAAACAGCSSSKSSTSSTSSPSASAPASASASASASPSASGSASATGAGATVAVASVGTLGPILVDAKGRTLYLFEADTSTQSTCTDACAAAWPPLTTSGAPVAGSGADTGLLGTTARSDGTTQVIYKGHPLYYYAGDSKAGDTNGQDVNQFGAHWYVLNAAGNKVESS